MRTEIGKIHKKLITVISGRRESENDAISRGIFPLPLTLFDLNQVNILLIQKLN